MKPEKVEGKSMDTKELPIDNLSNTFETLHATVINPSFGDGRIRRRRRRKNGGDGNGGDGNGGDGNGGGDDGNGPDVCGKVHDKCPEPQNNSYCEKRRGHDRKHRCASCGQEFPKK